MGKGQGTGSRLGGGEVGGGGISSNCVASTVGPIFGPDLDDPVVVLLVYRR